MTCRATFHPVLPLSLLLTFGVCHSVGAQNVSQPPPASTAVDHGPALSWHMLSRLKHGDLVSVRITGGGDVVGTIVSATESSLTVAVDGQPKTIPAADVQQVTKEGGRNHLKRGLLIGIPVGALVGSTQCYSTENPASGSGQSSCGLGVLAGAAIGGGIGAILGSAASHPAVVYSALPVRPTVGAQPPVIKSPTAIETPAPTEPLTVLSSRVTPFETIYVRTTDGKEIAGRFLHASETAVTLEADGQTREIAAGEVGQIWRRGSSRVKQGMLYGYLTGATIGVLATAASNSHEKGAGVFLSLTALGGAGLMWGAAIGALFHERPLMYPTSGREVGLVPVIAPDRAGVLASIRF